VVTTSAAIPAIDDAPTRVGRRRRARCAAVPVLLVLLLLSPCTAVADDELVVIPVQRDTTIMEAHPRDNDGAWGFLWLKWNSARGFENRVLLGFDLAPLAGRAGDVLSARIVLHAAGHTFPRRGTTLSAYFADATALPWREGAGQFDLFAYCGRRDLFHPPTGEGGPGATWACEDDLGAVDPLGAPSCGPGYPSSPWLGGVLPPPAVPEVPLRGFRATASTSQVEAKGYDPLCRRALKCFDDTGSADCWRAVAIDVTADVRATLAQHVHAASWLLKKDRVEAGAAHFFSREGALCRLGIAALGPRLEVTVVQGAQPPVMVPEPPIDCGG
jgi:hypothetical protein